MKGACHFGGHLKVNSLRSGQKDAPFLDGWWLMLALCFYRLLPPVLSSCSAVVTLWIRNPLHAKTSAMDLFWVLRYDHRLAETSLKAQNIGIVSQGFGPLVSVCSRC